MKINKSIGIVIVLVFLSTLMLSNANAIPIGSRTNSVTPLVRDTNSSIDSDINIAATGDGVVNLYAVVVGISDYKAISDLSYCDEDATDWYNYLNSIGYSAKVYGDGHTENYPRFDGYATEYNVKSAILDMISKADADDIIVFTSSGHGGSSGRTQFLCMWDCDDGENGEDGYIFDTEFRDLFQNSVSKVFIFLDHCNSGGMDEVMSVDNALNIYMTTTCGSRGFGYDVPEYENGAWTYWFCEKALVELGFTNMEEAFIWASDAYGARGQDAPMEFDGDSSSYFHLT
ncbi:MAG: caspase family protein [Candidatus Hodarchaeales archaeon]